MDVTKKQKPVSWAELCPSVHQSKSTLYMGSTQINTLV